MDVGYEGLDYWQVEDYSRAWTATAVAAPVQKKSTEAVMAKVLQTVFFASNIQSTEGPQKAKFL